jgi:hypothetical protein
MVTNFKNLNEVMKASNKDAVSEGITKRILHLIATS